MVIPMPGKFIKPATNCFSRWLLLFAAGLIACPAEMLAAPEPHAKDFPVQLPYASVWNEVSRPPLDLVSCLLGDQLPREIPGRRIPKLVAFGELDAPGLAARAVPLPEANTLAHVNFQAGRFGRLQDFPGAGVQW